jgi:hypothetical protein
LINIFLMATYFEHFFMYLLAIYISSLENCPIHLPIINCIICFFVL